MVHALPAGRLHDKERLLATSSIVGHASSRPILRSSLRTSSFGLPNRGRAGPRNTLAGKPSSRPYPVERVGWRLLQQDRPPQWSRAQQPTSCDSWREQRLYSFARARPHPVRGSLLSCSRRLIVSMQSANPATVGDSRMLRAESCTWNVSFSRETRSGMRTEVPPRSKKLS